MIPERPSAKTALPLWPLRVRRGRSPSEEPRSQKGGLLPSRCDPLGRQDSSTSIGDLLCPLYVDSGRLLRVTEKLGGHPKGGNSLKSLQEIRTLSDAHGSISIQEGQPAISKAFGSDRALVIPPLGSRRAGCCAGAEIGCRALS